MLFSKNFLFRFKRRKYFHSKKRIFCFIYVLLVLISKCFFNFHFCFYSFLQKVKTIGTFCFQIESEWNLSFLCFVFLFGTEKLALFHFSLGINIVFPLETFLFNFRSELLHIWMLPRYRFTGKEGRKKELKK